jgi:steroid delta-isomerase-like uncharacterized protein
MTSQQTAALIRRYYEAFNKKNWSVFLSLLSENVAHDLNQGPRQVGRLAFSKFMEDMDACYDETVVDLEVFVSDKNPKRAAAEFIIEGVYKKSQAGLPPANGQKYRLPVGAFFDVADEKVTRISNHYNMQDWIRQVQK